MVVAFLPVLVIGSVFSLNILRTNSRANLDVPQSVSASVVGTSAQIAWATGNETVAIVEYGTSSDTSSFQDFAISEVPSTSHSVTIPNLLPNTTYYYRIKINDVYYDDFGSPWSFSTKSDLEDTNTGVITPTDEDPGTSPTIVATPSATITSVASTSATPIVTTSTTPSPTSEDDPAPTPVSICQQTDCTAIKNALGDPCNTQDYLKCLNGSSLTPTVSDPGTTTTTTPSPTIAIVSATDRALCTAGYIQPNSCSSWNWPDVSTINDTCADTFTQYFVQCKSTSFSSSDPATWYCNERVSSNTLSLPCANAPSPAPGQSVFCRVRAETEAGGEKNATSWVTNNTKCSEVNSTIDSCKPSFLQANTCRSYLWDLTATKNPACSVGFSHYFLQCTSNGDFSGATGTWYCNNTTEDNYLDFPCNNAPTPADGAPAYCRVRAEDAYGTDNHASDWVTVQSTCPTSTPTPTPSPTPTNTPTPTPTP